MYQELASGPVLSNRARETISIGTLRSNKCTDVFTLMNLVACGKAMDLPHTLTFASNEEVVRCSLH